MRWMPVLSICLKEYILEPDLPLNFLGTGELTMSVFALKLHTKGGETIEMFRN